MEWTSINLKTKQKPKSCFLSVFLISLAVILLIKFIDIKLINYITHEPGLVMFIFFSNIIPIAIMITLAHKTYGMIASFVFVINGVWGNNGIFELIPFVLAYILSLKMIRSDGSNLKLTPERKDKLTMIVISIICLTFLSAMLTVY